MSNEQHELVGKTMMADESGASIDVVLYHDNKNGVYKLIVDLAYVADFSVDPATHDVCCRKVSSKHSVTPLSEWVCGTIAAHLGGSPLKAQ